MSAAQLFRSRASTTSRHRLCRISPATMSTTQVREHAEPHPPPCYPDGGGQLRYSVSEARVDGFRLRSGTILAREPEASTPRAGSLSGRKDPLLAKVKLIANLRIAAPAAVRWEAFPRVGLSGTTGFATRSATCGVARDRQDIGSATLCLAGQVDFRGRRASATSTSSPRMMASRCGTSFRTTNKPTRRMARTPRRPFR